MVGKDLKLVLKNLQYRDSLLHHTVPICLTYSRLVLRTSNYTQHINLIQNDIHVNRISKKKSAESSNVKVNNQHTFYIYYTITTTWYTCTVPSVSILLVVLCSIVVDCYHKSYYEYIKERRQIN